MAINTLTFFGISQCVYRFIFIPCNEDERNYLESNKVSKIRCKEFRPKQIRGCKI